MMSGPSDVDVVVEEEEDVGSGGGADVGEALVGVGEDGAAFDVGAGASGIDEVGDGVGFSDVSDGGGGGGTAVEEGDGAGAGTVDEVGWAWAEVCGEEEAELGGAGAGGGEVGLGAEEMAEELGATGSGAAEVAGTSGAVLGCAEAMTVVKDVMMTTGGICKDCDGTDPAGVFVVDTTGTWAGLEVG